MQWRNGWGYTETEIAFAKCKLMKRAGTPDKPKRSGTAVLAINCETGEETTYSSIKEAAKAIGKTSVNGIYNALGGRAYTAYGHIWERVGK